MTDWPVYFKDRLIVGNLDASVGVATLWMPKENVAAELDPKSYSVCGQLYTKRGINPLLRNVLANPKIRHLIICGVDRQGSGEALLKFFKDGFGKKKDGSGWEIVGDDEALIDVQISEEALADVRKSVEIFDMRMVSLVDVAKKARSLKPKKAFAKPRIFDEPVVSGGVRYPSDMSIFKVRRDWIGDAWVDALKIINRFGALTPGLYGQVKMVHNLCLVVEREDAQEPKIPSFMKFNKTGLDNYINGFFVKDRGSEHYTYGERLFDWDGVDQYAEMVRKLQGFPYDRGVMAVLWKPHVDNRPPKRPVTAEGSAQKGWTVPCLVMILAQCLDERLDLTAIFRSNDIYGAWPLNAFALRALQARLAGEIGKPLGSLTTVSHVAEIYEIDWEDSLHVVEAQNGLDRTCIYDSRSNYTIELEGKEIVVRFLSPAGDRQLAELRMDGARPKAARDLCAMALRDMLVSELGAAADLGRQLAKAETAVKLGLKFKQDNDLQG